MNDAASDDSSPSQGLDWLDAGEGEFLNRLSVATKELTDELGSSPSSDADLFFVGFLRMMSRFGVFSFGPITIYVPTVEEIVRRTASANIDPASFVRFSEVMQQEQLRSGRLDELHVLLAFMRLNEGLPARVFGELGVSPEQVEQYARSAGVAGQEPALEQLYSPEQAAEYLGIHVQTVRAWIRSGRLKASRLAGQRALRIRASDLATVLEPVEVDVDDAANIEAGGDE